MEEKKLQQESGFDSKDISETSKEASQSETWQKIRESLKHFTLGDNVGSNAYPTKWGMLVNKYLATGYKDEKKEHEISISNEVYKVLERENVTVFYDSDGNTLFDVSNERLANEYAPEQEAAGNEQENEQKQEDGVDTEKEIPAEIKDKGKADVPAEDYKDKACKKLQKEKEKAKDKQFADPVISYLIKRCEEDNGLAQDVIQEHKTWKKCFDYIYSQVRKQAKGNTAAVRDDVVYEWAEDYYHKDDKAEEEKKAKEAAERKKKEVERKKKADEKKSAKGNEKKKEAEKPAEVQKTKKNSKEVDGQIDFFSMMGM